MIFGTVKQVSIGPTSLMSLLVLPATYGKPIEYVFVLSFVAGCVELLLGVLKLGFIVDFIPLPVTSAFTSATALVIVASQLKSITGISYLATNFSSYLIGFFEHVSSVKLGDTVLGLGCITTLLLLRVSLSANSLLLLKPFAPPPYTLGPSPYALGPPLYTLGPSTSHEMRETSGNLT